MQELLQVNLPRANFEVEIVLAARRLVNRVLLAGRLWIRILGLPESSGLVRVRPRMELAGVENNPHGEQNIASASFPDRHQDSPNVFDQLPHSKKLTCAMAYHNSHSRLLRYSHFQPQ